MKAASSLLLKNHHSKSTTNVSLQLLTSGVPSESTGLRGKGKLGKETHLKDSSTLELDFDFDWDNDIGVPGAFLIFNRHNNEFYLKTLTLTNVTTVGRLHFVCNSWVYPEEHYIKRYRLFFSNQTYLPAETPQGLRRYREEELEELRGDGTGMREEWDRVYDYDVYNDLSQPDKGGELVRPIFGGSIDRPYVKS